jgi:hypothetical protein
MLVFTRTESRILQLKEQRGEKFRFAHAARALGLCPETVRQALRSAEWKCRLFEELPILAVNVRTMNRLHDLVIRDGWPLEVIASASDGELLHRKLIGRRTLPPLRALVAVLLAMSEEQRRTIFELL